MNSLRKFSPFNVYDFYGYLFPGAILTLFTFFFVVWFTPISFRNIMGLLEEAEKLQIILGVVGGSGFVAMVYFAGHVNGTLSHMVFDQTLMKRVVGYPFYTLLGIPNNMCGFSRAFNFYILLFVNVLIILPMVKLVFPDFVGFPYVYISILAIMTMVIILGVFVGILGGPEKVMQSDIHTKGHFRSVKRLIRKITKIINWFFCSGLSLSHRIFLPLMNLMTGSESVSSGVIDLFKMNIKELSGLSSDEIGSDNFWLPYIYMHRNEPEIEEHLSNWMNLYAFLKNLSFVAFILCFEMSLAVTLHFCNIVSLNHVTDLFDVQVGIMGFAFFYISAWILAFRYWTIYKNYFTKYLIRSFSSLNLSREDNVSSMQENLKTDFSKPQQTPIVDDTQTSTIRRRRRAGVSAMLK